MTKTQLQKLDQLELIQMAMKLKILPPNFLEIPQIYFETDGQNLLETQTTKPDQEFPLGVEEHENLVDEIFDVLVEQHSESLNDLASPLLESLHKFELELDRASGLAEPLPDNYFTDRLGLTKNKLHFILRDMEWAVIFWRLSTDIRNVIEREEHRQVQKFANSRSNLSSGQMDVEESCLSIAVHESPAIPKFGRQSKLGSFRGNFLGDYYLGANTTLCQGYQSNEFESLEQGTNAVVQTNFYSFGISTNEYKRYVFLRNDCNYYWAELYHYNSDYHRHVLLARSAIIYKPELLQIDQLRLSLTKTNSDDNSEKQNRWELYELSNITPKALKSNQINHRYTDIYGFK